MYVSPAEPPTLRALGTTASWVETDYGVDFFWVANGLKWGVQRKEVRDLVASLHDDRLARELLLMPALDYGIILIEGDWQWRNGVSDRVKGRMTRAQYVGVLCAMQFEHGLTTVETTGVKDSADTLCRIMSWTEKAAHGTLLSRSASPRVGIRDQQVWALQGFGLGPKTAEAVLDHFGGLPLTPTCSYTELCQVDGVGPKRARAFIGRFVDG